MLFNVRRNLFVRYDEVVQGDHDVWRVHEIPKLILEGSLAWS